MKKANQQETTTTANGLQDANSNPGETNQQETANTTGTNQQENGHEVNDGQSDNQQETNTANQANQQETETTTKETTPKTAPKTKENKQKTDDLTGWISNKASLALNIEYQNKMKEIQNSIEEQMNPTIMFKMLVDFYLKTKLKEDDTEAIIGFYKENERENKNYIDELLKELAEAKNEITLLEKDNRIMEPVPGTQKTPPPPPPPPLTASNANWFGDWFNS